MKTFIIDAWFTVEARDEDEAEDKLDFSLTGAEGWDITGVEEE